MTEWLVAIAGLLVFSAGGLVGYIFGWQQGTTDTERRWSDAVNRKEAR